MKPKTLRIRNGILEVSTFIHIIDYQVCVQTVHDSQWLLTKYHAMGSRNCTQIRCALRSAISAALEILVKKLQVKDTEAYQEMMRINYETFWGISTAILVIWPFAISVWARFWQNCWPNHYHSLSSSRSNSKKLSCRIWTCPNYMIFDEMRW